MRSRAVASSSGSVVVAQAKPSSVGVSVAAGRAQRQFRTLTVLSGLYLVAVVMLFASRVREFADESDNLLGGLLLVRGARLYVDYFSSHMPFAYVVAAIPAALG